jgi:hypothetical protein
VSYALAMTIVEGLQDLFEYSRSLFFREEFLGNDPVKQLSSLA